MKKYAIIQKGQEVIMQEVKDDSQIRAYKRLGVFRAIVEVPYHNWVDDLDGFWERLETEKGAVDRFLAKWGTSRGWKVVER